MTQTLSAVATPTAASATELTFAATLRAGHCAQRVAEGFLHYDTVFRTLTQRAPDRFNLRDWQGSQMDAIERGELYDQFVDDTLADIKAAFGESLARPMFWREVKRHFANLIEGVDDIDLCRTFFNTISQRLLKSTNGKSDGGKSDGERAIEFAAGDYLHTHRHQHAEVRRFAQQGTLQQLAMQALKAVPLEAEWQDLAVSSAQLANEINTKLGQGAAVTLDTIELLDTVFYRFTRAYAMGRITNRGWTAPLVLALANTESGVVIEAVLLSKAELIDLFRLSAACFHAELEQTAGTVAYLQKLMHRVEPDEILTTLGHPSAARERVKIS